MKDSPSDTRGIRADKRSRKRLLQDTEPSCSRAIHTESDEQGEPLLSARGLQQQFEELQRQRDAFLTEKTNWENEKTALLKKAESAFERVTATARGILSKTFSPTQVEYILTGIPIRNWCKDDISQALTLHNLSPKAYKYLRCKCPGLWPSVATLNRWAAKISVEPGLLQCSRPAEP
ncbi:hypothetical protein Pcinc_005972 [Petrolisthes cinctipes]|uniref:THAP9-like helix-turn-helix domain-containing protein n=1 Tax=Petrolisthes cinctipes TaxID=88211 RepID=A0AAE1GDV9_PETCI|nr:hypothetical protein Pcinc_005972 [Petrolisthes cinctipes]